MSQEQLNNENTDSKTSISSRRKFLVKASAGALVATIPAKSVWATATATTGSVMGSNHGSDALGGATLHIKKPHEWSAYFGKILLEKKYIDAALSAPVVGTSLTNIIGLHNTSHLRLCHILGAESAIISFLVNDCGCKVNANKKLVVSNGNGTKTYHSISKVHKWLKDNNEVNSYVVSAYLNAKMHGIDGIVYPVAKTSGNKHAPFDTPEDFLENLHKSRITSASHTASLLKKLHFSPNSV